jgi:hypothetical protein
MQSELIRSLQIALQYENAVLDLTKLQEDAVMNRRDVLSALDDLRTRLLQQPAQHDPTTAYMHLLPRRPSLESVQTFATSQTLTSEALPPGVSIPQEEESKGAFGRLLSMRRGSKKMSVSSPSRDSLLPTLDWIAQAAQPNEHPAVRPTEYELPAEDVKRSIPAPETQFLHPAMAKDPPVSRHVSNSTSTRSDYSDEKIPVISEEEESGTPISPGTVVEIAGALPPQHFFQSNHSRYPSTSSTNASIMSPTSTTSTTSPLPSPTISVSPDPTFAFRRRSVARPLSSSTRSSTYSHRTSSINMPAPATTGPTAMLGRPSKDNNYWGFCKGAWTTREDWRKGLSIQTIPTGMYNTKLVWRCKWCAFEGEVFGAKKPYQVDHRVFTALESGVRYKFLFLAKSHVKRKQGRDDNTCFGCVVCINEGKGTSIFGNVETLCNHLVVEHGKFDMSEEMQGRNRCVVGRVAEVGEEFDFNIPGGLACVDEDREPMSAGPVEVS